MRLLIDFALDLEDAVLPYATVVLNGMYWDVTWRKQTKSGLEPIQRTGQRTISYINDLIHHPIR